MTNLSSFIEQTAAAFQAAGIESSQVDAELLIAFDLGVSRGQLQAMAFQGEAFEPSKKLLEFIERRTKREPLQHLTGKAYFRNLALEVGKGVFIPRPETEAVVEIAIDFLRDKPAAKVLDVGTGSGAIAISIATELNLEVDAIEKSALAAAYAQKNIEANLAKVNLLVGDFREQPLELGSYDLVISNPPYIPNSAIPIDPEVRDHDPDMALYGGEDGLDLIREIVDLSWLLLKPSGMLALEHADGQSDSVRELLLENWLKPRVHPDPTGRLRAVSAIR